VDVYRKVMNIRGTGGSSKVMLIEDGEVQSTLI